MHVIRFVAALHAAGVATVGAQQSQPSLPGCYEGPLEIRVLDPSGEPSAHVGIAIFGATWSSRTGEDPPPRYKPHRTNSEGRFSMPSVRECLWPTFLYAFDEGRKLAGVTVIDDLSTLANVQTVRLEAARSLIGRIDSEELRASGLKPTFRWVHLALNEGMLSRQLRYYPGESGEFRFLLPTRRYLLEIGGTRLEVRRQVPLEVSAGDEPVDLGDIDLPMSPLARLVDKPAPPLHIAQWADGQRRLLSDYRGRPVALCLWHIGSDPAQRLSGLHALHKQLTEAGGTILAISRCRARWDGRACQSLSQSA